MINFSLDISLIIECCKTTQDKNKITELIRGITDWDEFIDLLYSHGVFPLVYHTLKAHTDLIPLNTLQTMKSWNMDIVKENMLMTTELIKIMKLLEEDDIEAIAFKGPTLSQMAYGDISLRQYADLDILVDKNNIYKIRDLLTDKYKRDLKLTASQEPIWFKYAHDLGLTNAKDIHIEFHWTMLDSDYPINLKDIDFFSHNSSVNINNHSIPTISNEEFLIYLCVHGSKHLFERVEWIVDIDKFIRTQSIDWDRFHSIFKDKNYKTFVYLGLYLAKSIFSTPINNDDKQFNDDIKTVSTHIFALWSGSKDFNNKTNLKYMLKLFISTKDKLKYLHKIYLKPTFTEYWYINFPKPLYFLYYPLRQYLLIKKYLLK